MRSFIPLAAALMLAGCSSGSGGNGSSLPDVSNGITLEYVATCLHSYNSIVTTYALKSEKRRWIAARGDYWRGARIRKLYGRVDRQTARKIDRAMQERSFAERKLSRKKLRERHLPVLEACATQEVPLDRMEIALS